MRRRRQVDRDRRLCCYDIAGIEHDSERIWADRVAKCVDRGLYSFDDSAELCVIRDPRCSLCADPLTVSEWRVFD